MDYANLLGLGGEQSVPQVALAQPTSQMAPMPQVPEPPMAPPPQQAAAPEQAQSPGFLDKLRTDPAFSQAMLMMGARLMQGPKPGQDFMGMVGDATMVGATAHGFVRQNEQANAIEQEKLVLQGQESAARVAESGARTAQAQQTTRQEGILFPQTQAKLLEETRRLKNAGDLAGAQALVAQYRADPERLAADWKLDQDKTSAQTAHTQAQTARLEAETADPQKFKTQYGSNKLDDLTAMEKYIRQANPGMNDQEIAQQLLNMRQTKKGQDLELLKTIVANGDPNSPQVAYAMAKLAEEAGYVEEPAGATPGKPAKPVKPLRGQKPTTPVAPAGMKPAAAGGLPPKEQLVTGNTYSINGKDYIWSGTGFAPVKK